MFSDCKITHFFRSGMVTTSGDDAGWKGGRSAAGDDGCQTDRKKATMARKRCRDGLLWMRVRDDAVPEMCLYIAVG